MHNTTQACHENANRPHQQCCDQLQMRLGGSNSGVKQTSLRRGGARLISLAKRSGRKAMVQQRWRPAAEVARSCVPTDRAQATRRGHVLCSLSLIGSGVSTSGWGLRQSC